MDLVFDGAGVPRSPATDAAVAAIAAYHAEHNLRMAEPVELPAKIAGSAAHRCVASAHRTPAGHIDCPAHPLDPARIRVARLWLKQRQELRHGLVLRT